MTLEHPGAAPFAPAEFAIILRGGPAVGKSTIGRALADRLPRSAHVEQDVLRYMVRGGVVAARAGQHPSEAPDEYERQCRLADLNALVLARSFAEAGFIPVITGLDGGESATSFRAARTRDATPWTPSPGDLDQRLPRVAVFQFVLDAPPDVLRSRLTSRGLDLAAQDFVLDQRSRFLQRVPTPLRQTIIDTSSLTVEAAVSRIVAEVPLRRS